MGSDERGLVISCPIEVSGTSLLVKNAALDPQDLRSSLLFWDKLDFPDQHVFGFGLSPDAEFLLKEHILQRTMVAVSGRRGGDILRAAHVGAFRQLDSQQPGMWSVSSGVNSISFLEDELEEGRGALVRLYGAIPVPTKEVPLNDILEFRTKRRAELLALRHHLEQVYQRVIAAGDGPLALRTEIGALQSAIEDHVKASRETGFKFRLSNLNASLNLAPIAIGAISAVTMDLPLIAGLLPGAAAGLSLNISAALTGRTPQPTPFRYVSTYHQEVF